nr:hypothetical protein GCM10020185_75040 [Pseudomonas brassicacearum subsp. brassicacearum]
MAVSERVKSEHDFLRHNVSVTNDAGDFTVQPRDFTRDENVRTATAGVRNWFHTGPVSHEVNLAASYFYMDFENGGARYANGRSNLYEPVQTPAPSNPTRQDDKVYTENRFSGVALSDTLGLFDDRLLLTLGARWQRVKVDDWTNNVKGDTAYDEEKGFTVGRHPVQGDGQVVAVCQLHGRPEPGQDRAVDVGERG